MSHKTHLELNDEQHDYLLDLCYRQGKTLTAVIHDLIDEKKQYQEVKPVKIKRAASKPLKHLDKHRELIAKSFDDFHYGE